MANPELVEVVTLGTRAVEAWRERNPTVELNLRGADLRGAILPSEMIQTGPNKWTRKGPDLRGADLTEANLDEANLRHAVLSGADLRGAYPNLRVCGGLGTKDTLRDGWPDCMQPATN